MSKLPDDFPIVPVGSVALLITHRSPSGRWEYDDIIIVSEMDAVRLKFELGDDCQSLMDLLED